MADISDKLKTHARHSNARGAKQTKPTIRRPRHVLPRALDRLPPWPTYGLPKRREENIVCEYLNNQYLRHSFSKKKKKTLLR